MLPGDQFGFDIDMSSLTGQVLTISAPNADQYLYLQYKGYYKEKIRYSKDDVVYQYGGFWKYKLDFNPTHDNVGPPPFTTFNASNWNIIFTPTTAFKGTFNSNLAYDKSDIVIASGLLYIALEDIPGDGSPINFANWAYAYPRETTTGKVFVYQYNGDSFELKQTIGRSNSLEINSQEKFGESVAVSDTGNYIAIGSVLTDRYKNDQGRVKIFKLSTSLYDEYTPQQDLYSLRSESREKFGASVEFMNDDQTLVIFSTNGDIKNETSFDSELTTLDNSSTKIIEIQVDSGRVDVFDRYDQNFIYGESLLTPTLDEDSTYNDITDKYGTSIAVGSNNILVTAPYEDSIEFKDTGRVYSYMKSTGTKSWKIAYIEKTQADSYKIKKAYLYNKTNNQLVTYLDVVDPIQGKIPGIADQEIKFKTFFDPAIYTNGTSGVNVDSGLNWSSRHVGMLWWDLTNAKFIDHSVGEVTYRSVNWNKLYQTASIDIYEWVGSKYLPSEWNDLSGTEEGFAEGISGVSKYDDTVYSLKQKYDTVSQSFINTYFYWVKNPSLLPSVEGRLITAANVSSLISDPIGYGYPCIALTGTDSFSLVNVKNLLDDTNVILNVQYWIIEDQTKNAHSQWKIVSEHINTIIPIEVEEKWISSLVGKDTQNRILPDPKLPAKLKYGIESRPRQSMFVNRIEALKQLIERVNSVLSKRLIVDDYDLTDLSLSQNYPSNITGEWDVRIDTEEELRFIGTVKLQIAELVPVIESGRIVDVEITSRGFGYTNAPYISVSGAGKGAFLRTVLDEFGRVVGVTILESGEGYTSTTKLNVRPYSVLVLNDTSSFDKWSIYSWNIKIKEWDKIRTQGYDVSLFWDYIDWYNTGYSQYTKINHAVENTYELSTYESNIGEIVKVKNIGSGGWVLLEKYNNLITIDYTQNYKVVARQNGTIKFKSTLYSFVGTNLGYGGNLYDSNLYDNSATEELKIILDTIKNKILVDELRIEYLKCFFASVRYVFNEQYFVDWALKTSFVKATHNAGSLKQKVNYNNDNLEDFEKYVSEVKPYRTKAREYISAYTNVDQSQSSVSDFDLPPVIDTNFNITPVSVMFDEETETMISVNNELTMYPWKHWYDNVGFTVESITIIDGGSGYIGRPEVRIVGGYGSGAVAKAYINAGKVNRIDLINKGSGYLKAPTIIIDGGLISEGGIPARASAQIENSLVRSNKISIKFDRITRNYFVTDLEETETFVGTGSRLQFALRFSPVTTTGSVSITINGNDVLQDDFTLISKKSTTKGYVSYSGLVTFKTAPANNAVIVITYMKDFNHLSAADRINFYYNPATGMLGKDLAQLMQGIDFGGVNITGLGFGARGGWDALPWFSEGWDGFDAEFDDYIVTAGDSSYSYTLPYIPTLGQEINIYVNGKRIDDPYFDSYDGVASQPNGRKVAPDGVVMQTWVGNGITSTITLPDLTDPGALDINTGDKIIFRKNTSDGALAPDINELDTQLTGGNLAYSTATGFAPDDIILDGEGFVTPAQSHAPEEIVPGYITDAVAIKVFRLPRSGPSTIFFKNYICDGQAFTFDVGQFPNSFDGVFVKLDNVVLTRDVDFTFNWKLKTVSMVVTPANGKVLNVISFGVAGDNILDTNYFVSDGSTIEYLTNAPWPQLDNDQTSEDAVNRLGSVILVNGIPAEYELFKTDSSYEHPNFVGIKLAETPLEGSIINYLINADASESLSTVWSQAILVDGVSSTYTLTSNTVGVVNPFENNVLVIKNGDVLESPSNTNYKMLDYQMTYEIPEYKAEYYVLDPANIKVFSDGRELISGVEWTMDSGDLTVTIDDAMYKEGALLQILDFTNAEYIITNNDITFTELPLVTDEIRVISFYNHNVEKIIRTNDRFDITSYLTPASPYYYTFNSMRGGEIKLIKTMRADDYIWVIKNNKLLSHSIDFYLDDDFRTLKFSDSFIETDTIDVILFGDDDTSHGFGWMQFKDMLNRVHYKRISKAKSTRLSIDLQQKDVQIFVEDGSALANPNRNSNLPGIIEINGERIEYFTKDNNVLGQLRRGTLGTGVPTVHRSNSYIIDIGPSETIPYTDQHIVETFISDGSTNALQLNYTPSSVNEVDVFVGGYRLKKVNYNIFGKLNVDNILVDPDYPYSPEGDITLPAQFSVDGTTTLRLTDDAPENSRILVIKKIGRVWEDALDVTEIFRNISAPVNGALFDVIKTQTIYSVVLKHAGLNYEIGDQIILPGAYLGGTSPENDITITVTDVRLDRGIDYAARVKAYCGELPVAPGDLVAGQTYIIDQLGSTNWQSVGAPLDAVVGTEFVATSVGFGSGRAFIPSDTTGTIKVSLVSEAISPIWPGKYWRGNGGEGVVTEITSSNTFNVRLTRDLAARSSMITGSWNIFAYANSIKSINTFTYSGTGRYKGFVTKTLRESNNPIANFLKNTETIYPNYSSDS